MIARRRFVAGITLPALYLFSPAHARGARLWQPPELPEGAIEEARLERLPNKLALIKRTYRPPNFETPIEYFRTPITRNAAFFVRYHLAGIPPSIALRDWRLRVAGAAASHPLELDIGALRKDFEQVEVVAVNQCAGNRRGMFVPHVAGVEWGVGAMGNARWKGVRLRDVLAKAGIRKEAVEVAFDGADFAVLKDTPDFVKSIPVERALDENTLIALEMNDAPLPYVNGFPARLVVPGWTGTYWVKHLIFIDIRTQPLDTFWMKSAYRIPAGLFPNVDRFPTQGTPQNQPITDIVVNSLVTSIFDGERVRHGRPVDVNGIAWDGGRGIRAVEVSIDGGGTWEGATLQPDMGRFSFRPFRHRVVPRGPGPFVVMVRAINMRGDTQSPQLLFNPAGYHHNVIPHIRLQVV